MDRIDTGVEQADEWRYEGPCGDLAGAIATEGGKIGRTERESERKRGYPVKWEGGHGTSSEITCDRPKHRSAAFMLKPVSNLWERKGVREGRDTETDREREGVRKQQRRRLSIINHQIVRCRGC